MTTAEKTAIYNQVVAYCNKKGGLTPAAHSLTGVSRSTLNNILKKDWVIVSEDMLRNVIAQIERAPDDWVMVKTRPYKRMLKVMTDAQKNALVVGVTGFAGCGKSAATKSYTADHDNVYRIECADFWNRKRFLTKIAGQLGIASGGTVAELLDDIIIEFYKKKNPLLIIDEVDKLKDEVLYFFITLYNELEGRCGIVLSSTNYIEDRIKKGIRLNKKGFNEIYSRLGRNFVPLQVINTNDIAAVCIANGITNKDQINIIMEDCDNDLRRVQRKVHAFKIKGQCDENESDE